MKTAHALSAAAVNSNGFFAATPGRESGGASGL